MQNEGTNVAEAGRKKVEELGKEKEAATLDEGKTAKKQPTTKKKTIRKPKVITTSAKRKSAVARATLMQGSGRIFVNRTDVNAINSRYVRESILEPVKISGITIDIANNSDINVTVRGGGASGQAQAARSAIAKAISEASKSDIVRKMYLDYDRTLLVDDIRRVESKKFEGPKARARFQKSYR